MTSTEKKLVCGVGVNDADYVTQKTKPDHSARYVNGKYKQKLVWVCPFYITWANMLKRCYSEKYQEKYPTYKGCTVCEEWKLFSNFRKWMVEQEWEGLQLDKDLLVVGNKVYSAETCVFVTCQVNNFLGENDRSRGEWPIGVSWNKRAKKFYAKCSNPITGKLKGLGYFTCQHEAHRAWLAKKLEHAYALAAIQTDQRVAIALIERYENYTIEIGEM